MIKPHTVEDAMLYSLDSQKWIEGIWHQADFDRWRRRLTNQQHAVIQAELNRFIDTREIATSRLDPWRRLGGDRLLADL